VLTSALQDIDEKKINLFDDFVIVGINSGSESLQESSPSCQDSLSPTGLSLFKEDVEAENILSFTHSLAEIESCPRRKVLKSFCFPNDL